MVYNYILFKNFRRRKVFFHFLKIIQNFHYYYHYQNIIGTQSKNQYIRTIYKDILKFFCLIVSYISTINQYF